MFDCRMLPLTEQNKVFQSHIISKKNTFSHEEAYCYTFKNLLKPLHFKMRSYLLYEFLHGLMPVI